jgi:hypothetical protein
MRFGSSVIALSFLALMGGCAYPVYPGQPSYPPTAVEQPQPVDFFYGTVVDIRPVPVHYRDGGGFAFGFAPAFPAPVIGASFSQEPGASGGDIRIGALRIFAGGATPDLPAVEYTVVLDKNTNPADPYLRPGQRPAIVIVQNRYATDLPLNVGDRAFVRVIGDTAHVMRADTLPPGLERTLSAGPMPIPVAYPAVFPAPTCPLDAILSTVICHPYDPPPVAVAVQ